mmetsp:Transcript_71814/g.189373  ORF Transcript_71814/g.189373 Transcript_71814/m.189373 type:complete len:204 (-) Transcript_71814:175-786(-)
MALVCSVCCMRKAFNSLSCLSLSAFISSIASINSLLASSLLNNWFFKLSAVFPSASSSSISFLISLIALVFSFSFMRKAFNSLSCLSLSAFISSIASSNFLLASSLLNKRFFRLAAIEPLASSSPRSNCMSSSNFLLMTSLPATSSINFRFSSSLSASSDTRWASCALASESCWIKASSSLAMRASSCSAFDNIPTSSICFSS